MPNPTVVPIMTPARGPNVPDAQPIYPVDVYGNPVNQGGRFARTVLSLPSAARATYSSGPLAVGDLSELAIDFNVTAFTGGTSPTVTFLVSRIGADGVLYQLSQIAAISVAGSISYNQGVGASSGTTPGKPFGTQIQVDMIVTGAPTSITFSGSIIGK